MKVSVLLPTRRRVKPLIVAINSLLDNFSNENEIEILLRFDMDDLETMEAVKNLYIKDDRVHFIVGQKYGYRGSYIYLNELSFSAKGDWLLLFNDDAIMRTKNWDKEIEKYNGKIVFVDTITQKLHFPIIPRVVVNVLGHFSLATQCDSWMCDIGDRLNIRVNSSIDILHDRADLTGNNDDDTYRNSQKQYQTNYRNPMDESLREKDAMALIKYIEITKVIK